MNEDVQPTIPASNDAPVDNTINKVDSVITEIASRAPEPEAADELQMPATVAKTDHLSPSARLDEVAERIKQWNDKTPEERQQDSAVARQIAARKAEAERMGVSLQERELIEQNLIGRQGAEMQPIVNVAQELWPQEQPTHAVKNVLEAARYLQKDPAEGLKWLAGELGVDWRRLSNEDQPGGDYVAGIIDGFLSDDEMQDDAMRDRVLTVINDPAFQRSGNIRADLMTAYRQAKAKPQRPKQKPGKQDWQATLRAVGERLAS